MMSVIERLASWLAQFIGPLLELLASSPGLFIGTCLVLGLLVGSFLNVVIYRLPIILEREWAEETSPKAEAPPQPRERFNLVVPRSACPSCKAPITALQNIPVGTTVHAVELKPGGGAKMGRSAGTGIQLLAREGRYATLRMPSGEVRQVLVTCRATVGEVGNAEQSNINLGKAGRSRWKGRRPKVRGVAMNPVDHPHGGGEGKTSGGRHPVNPKGKPEGRTRRKNKDSDRLIIRRRSSGKKG